MSKSTPSSVTAEEAVARMVNMDYIPEGFTLEDMLSAFKEEAEVEHYNAGIDHLPITQIDSLKVRLDACKARESLALMLLADLREEAQKTQGSAIVRANDSSSKPRYTLESIADWVSYKYGIGIPEWSPQVIFPSTSVVYKHETGDTDRSSDLAMPSPSSDEQNAITWEDIEIRIRKDNKIAFSHTKGKWIQKAFAEVGLLDKRTQEPNYLAGILLGLAIGKKFPPSTPLENRHKTAITRLRNSLKTLTGIKSEPFKQYNNNDGWKPRFKLTDDRRNADERAKKAAKQTPYDDDGMNYEKIGDAADEWIEENQ